MTPIFKPIADSAVLIEFENRIDEQVHNQVLALMHAVDQSWNTAIREMVPAYKSLLIYYNPVESTYSELVDSLEQLSRAGSGTTAKGDHWEIPVWYGGPTALDLEHVARANDLSPEEVINIHSGNTYRVYLVGFAPGWTFLGGLDSRLHTPRLKTPRAEVPEGSISIAGQQGLICGPAMPSGWNLIGQTPIKTWNPQEQDPCFIKPGDTVSFRQIDGAEFDLISNGRSGFSHDLQSRHPGRTSA